MLALRRIEQIFYIAKAASRHACSYTNRITYKFKLDNICSMQLLSMHNCIYILYTFPFHIKTSNLMSVCTMYVQEKIFNFNLSLHVNKENI